MKPLAVLGQLLSQVVERIPLERLLIKPTSNKKRLEDLQEILSESHAQPTEVSPETPAAEREELEEGSLEPRQQKVHLAPKEGGLSTEETVADQNREIGQLLLTMERHYAKKMRHAGVPCDCGSGKHLLDMEFLAKETIPMVDDTNFYYRLIEWINTVGPVSTDEAAKSKKYDNIYPHFSHEARDFRKELIGTLDPKALWPGEHGSLEDLLRKYHEKEEHETPASIETVP